MSKGLDLDFLHQVLENMCQYLKSQIVSNSHIPSMIIIIFISRLLYLITNDKLVRYCIRLRMKFKVLTILLIMSLLYYLAPKTFSIFLDKTKWFYWWNQTNNELVKLEKLSEELNISNSGRRHDRSLKLN